MLDTLNAADQLTGAGFNPQQAKALVTVIRDSEEAAATKTDLAELRVELKSEIGAVKADLKVSTAALEAKMWKAGITIAGLAVLLNKFLDWVIA